MPSRNSLKEYAPHTYYHIYNRGVEKCTIFRDAQDYAFFIKLLRKYLDPGYEPSAQEVLKPTLAHLAEVVSYCLLPNHFHILIYQLNDEKALEKLFRSVMTAYVMYFNNKYKRVGPLFQGRYKASRIDSDSYLYHISRYIHLNPLDTHKSHIAYPYSSYMYYVEPKNQTFVKTHHVLGLFDNESYPQFVDDYVEQFKARPKGEDGVLGLSYSGQS